MSNEWVIGLGRLSRAFHIDKRTLYRVIDRVNLYPYFTTSNKRAFLRCQLHLLVERIYYADNGLRPKTLARLFNAVSPLQKFTYTDFKRVSGRWVVR